MIGWNELVFFADVLTAGVILLGAARLGRAWLTALIVICALLMNLLVMKKMTLFGLSVTGGNVFLTTVILANDVLNEHFGRRAAQKAVVIGFASGMVAAVMTRFSLLYQPNADDMAHQHLSFFFSYGAYPRIIAASMISYLLTQLLDSYVYDWIRKRTGQGRLLWLRSNASAWAAQAFDTLFYTTFALLGSVLHSWREWWEAVIFAYLIKIGVAAVHTSFLYLTTWRPFLPPGSERPAWGETRKAGAETPDSLVEPER